MDRTTLEKNGIFFEEDLTQIRVLPRHVSTLRSALLDFDCTVPDRLSISNDEHLRCLADVARDEGVSALELVEIKKTIDRWEPVKRYAKRLSEGQDREAEWQSSFFLAKFFEPLMREVEVAEEDSRRVSRAKFYYEYFEQAQGRPWTLFRKEKGYRAADRQGLAEPKPDLVAFFPIHYFKLGTRPTTTRRWQWDNFPKDSVVENFSYEVLRDLGQRGLQSSTADLFQENKKVALSDCICFPWLVVEHKKSGEDAEHCYCQAANAASATVMMLESLATYAEDRLEAGHIPPVTTITTIGSTVRVWVMYKAPLSNYPAEYIMACIWKGDMTEIMQLLYFQAILENLHTWATRVLRPWISSYIDQWRAQSPATGREPSPPPDEPTTTSLTVLGPSKSLALDADPGDKGEDTDGRAPLEDILQAHHRKLMDRFEELERVVKESLSNQKADKPTHASAPPVAAGSSLRTIRTGLEGLGPKEVSKFPRTHDVAAPLEAESIEASLQALRSRLRSFGAGEASKSPSTRKAASGGAPFVNPPSVSLTQAADFRGHPSVIKPLVLGSQLPLRMKDSGTSRRHSTATTPSDGLATDSAGSRQVETERNHLFSHTTPSKTSVTQEGSPGWPDAQKTTLFPGDMSPRPSSAPGSRANQLLGMKRLGSSPPSALGTSSPRKDAAERVQKFGPPSTSSASPSGFSGGPHADKTFSMRDGNRSFFDEPHTHNTSSLNWNIPAFGSPSPGETFSWEDWDEFAFSSSHTKTAPVSALEPEEHDPRYAPTKRTAFPTEMDVQQSKTNSGVTLPGASIQSNGSDGKASTDGESSSPPLDPLDHFDRLLKELRESRRAISSGLFSGPSLETNRSRGKTCTDGESSSLPRERVFSHPKRKIRVKLPDPAQPEPSGG